MKKVYEAPALVTEEMVLGVFGNYNGKGTGIGMGRKPRLPVRPRRRRR